MSLLRRPVEEDEDEHRDHHHHDQKPEQKGVFADPNNATVLGSNAPPIPFPTNQPFIRMSADLEYDDANPTVLSSLSSASTESS